MKEKAFTLVELLAVIVVLGILLIIAVPRISDAVNVSKKKSFEISVKSLEKELKSLYIKDNFNISKNGKSYVITNKAFVGETLDVKGEIPDSGNLYIDEEGKTAFIIKKNNLCAVKDFYDDNIFVSDNPALCILNVPEPVPEICFTYTSTVTEVTITGYDNACSKNVIIPDTLGGLPVKIIGASAFRGDTLKSVSIPNTVTTIDQQAFQQSVFSRITIPNSVTTIGVRAFYLCKITDLYLPDSVTSLGREAFGSNKITSIRFSPQIKYIVEETFAYNNIVNLVIPDSIERIHYGAFGHNPLETIEIGSGLHTLHYSYGQYGSNNANVFSWSDNLQITISPSNSSFVAFNGGIYSTDMKTIYFGTPSVSQNLPSTVENIAQRAFSNMNITNLVIPNSVTSIGRSAFERNLLTSVIIQGNPTHIDSYAFSDNQLTSVTLPSNISIINNTVSPSFYTAYVTDNGSAGGTYTAPSQSGTWTKQ